MRNSNIRAILRLKPVGALLLAILVAVSMLCGCTSSNKEQKHKKHKTIITETDIDETEETKGNSHFGFVDETEVPVITDVTDVVGDSDSIVGISMPTEDLRHWKNTGLALESLIGELGYHTYLSYEDNSVANQLETVEFMINLGCDVIIIAPIDPYSFTDVLESAKEKDVTIISYDRLIMDSDAVSYYVNFDNYMVGTLQGECIVNELDLDNADGPFNLEIFTGDPEDKNALLFYTGAMDVLYPYIESGKLIVKSGEIDFETVAIDNWSSSLATERMFRILDDYYSDGENIDAIMCSNDSTAYGVILALKEDYSGTWPVITGMDCDILNVKCILNGEQSMSVFKEDITMQTTVVSMVHHIFMGEVVETNDNTTFDNGEIVVPTILCEVVSVDINNYEYYLIDSGYYTKDSLGL
ncbi:MAG: sugar-binding protein [Clostridia bacterium]|nr:sugar-binding protein [Clostridia bacterium]